MFVVPDSDDDAEEENQSAMFDPEPEVRTPPLQTPTKLAGALFMGASHTPKAAPALPQPVTPVASRLPITAEDSSVTSPLQAVRMKNLELARLLKEKAAAAAATVAHGNTAKPTLQNHAAVPVDEQDYEADIFASASPSPRKHQTPPSATTPSRYNNQQRVEQQRPQPPQQISSTLSQLDILDADDFVFSPTPKPVGKQAASKVTEKRRNEDDSAGEDDEWDPTRAFALVDEIFGSKPSKTNTSNDTLKEVEKSTRDVNDSTDGSGSANPKSPTKPAALPDSSQTPTQQKRRFSLSLSKK